MKSPLLKQRRKLDRVNSRKDLWDRHVPSNDPRNNRWMYIGSSSLFIYRVENQGREGQCNARSAAEKNIQPWRQRYCLVCKRNSSVQCNYNL